MRRVSAIARARRAAREVEGRNRFDERRRRLESAEYRDVSRTKRRTIRERAINNEERRERAEVRDERRLDTHA